MFVKEVAHEFEVDEDIRDQNESRRQALQETYGEAMLELRA
jgi:hypothetical protein